MNSISGFIPPSTATPTPPHLLLEPELFYNPPYDRREEDDLAWHLVRHLSPLAALRSRVSVRTPCGHLSVDLLVECAGRRVAFMYGNDLDEHEVPLRVASIIGAGEVDVLFRLRAEDLEKRLHDCLLCIARWEPALFSTKGHIHLEGLASPEAWASPPMQGHAQYRLVYERPAETDVYDGEEFEWDAVVTGELVVHRYSRDRPDTWMDAYQSALAQDATPHYYARAS